MNWRMRKIIRTVIWTQIEDTNFCQIYYSHCMTYSLSFSLMWQRKLVFSLSVMFFPPARTQSPRVCGVFHEPFRKWIHKQTERHMHRYTHAGNAHVSHPLFWACRRWDPWQPNTEGRKICVLPGRAPSLWQSCKNS